ncbi:MAG: YtxH domain-containing protein [bacterium]|nr:YtxH domain-containing protein [bacterium]
MSKKGVGKFLAGAALGVGLGVLLAPKKGSETRQDLKLKIDELVCKVKNIDKEEVKEVFLAKIDELKDLMEDLDKEKVLKIAKAKAIKLREKTDDLIKLAKENATPVLQSIANDVREKSIIVTKEVLKKLENSK